MAYGQFAYIYDHLMQDVPYDKWIAFVKKVKQRYGYSSDAFSIVDVACGTGELAIRFAREGWNVAGVDLSESMLTVANEKAQEEGLAIPFYEQNMVDIEGFTGIDCMTIFCDSLNYLKTVEEVKKTFQSAYAQLNQGGLLLFDVHSVYKITQIFMNATFTSTEEEVSYIWNCFPGDEPNSVEHDLTFFVLDEETNRYTRFDELHYQRTYSMELYKKWLMDAGFKLQLVTGDFSTEILADQAERVFFVAQKM